MATLLLASACSAANQSSMTSHPGKITVDGKTLYRATGPESPSGAILDSQDPRRLLVLYAVPIDSPHARNQCPSLRRPFGFVVKQTSRSVVLDIGGYQSRPAAAPSSTGAARYYLCVTSDGAFRQLPVTLSDPLGSRAVFSVEDTTRPMTLISDRSVPAPRFVPAGYKAAGLDATLDLEGKRRYRRGIYELDVIAGDPRVSGPITSGGTSVGGHPAVVVDTQQFRSIRWSVAPHRAIEVVASIAGHNTTDISGALDLSLDVLLRVARSL